MGHIRHNNLVSPRIPLVEILMITKEKKSEISADFSAIFRFSVGVEKKIHGKNRLKKFRRKIVDFSPKNQKIPTFSRKNPIFPEKIRFSRNLG